MFLFSISFEICLHTLLFSISVKRKEEIAACVQERHKPRNTAERNTELHK